MSYSLPEPDPNRPIFYSGKFVDMEPMPLADWQRAMDWCEAMWQWMGIPVNRDPNQIRCGWWGETQYQLPLCWRGWASE